MSKRTFGSAIARWGEILRSLREPRRLHGRQRGPTPAERARLLGAMAIPEPEPATEPVRSIPSAIWERIELYHDQRSLFRHEPFIDKLLHREPEIVAAFGRPDPPSGYWLLHYGKRWEQNLGAQRAEGRSPVPVLLIHGAGHTANTGFPRGPLLAELEAQGHVLFAISFAHPHGDNWQQAEALAGAIARVRLVTGAERVDLVAHSKGCVPARLYTSGLHLPEGTPYRGDVRRLVLCGSPNLGIDYAFRHPLLFWVGAWFGNAPSPYLPPLRYSLYPGGAYPGQAQMVRELRDLVPLGDPDVWNTPRLYGGGLTLYGYSRGVRWTAQAGGQLIDRLNEAGIDPGIEIAVLGGNNPRLSVDGVPVGETDGESDGLLFVPSAMHTDGLICRGARLLTADLLPLNHLELVEDPKGTGWILKQLA
jgi:triacylglycerol lipase